MKINEERLENSIVYMNRSIASLNDASQKLSSIKMPEGFYSRDINNAKSDISQIVEIIARSKNSVRGKISDFEIATAKNEALIASLGTTLGEKNNRLNSDGTIVAEVKYDENNIGHRYIYIYKNGEKIRVDEYKGTKYANFAKYLSEKRNDEYIRVPKESVHDYYTYKILDDGTLQETMYTNGKLNIQEKLYTDATWSDFAKEFGKQAKQGIVDIVKDESKTLKDVTERTGATITILKVGVAEQIAKLGERIIDTAIVLGSGYAASETARLSSDPILNLTGQNAISVDELPELTEETLEACKATVKKEPFKNFFADLYKRFNEKSYIKSDSKIIELEKGIVETAGIAMLGPWTILGAGANAFGRSTEEAWNAGADFYQGVAWGGLNAAWEGIQWKVGTDLNEWKGFSNRFLTGVTRVGIDTTFNTLDTPFKALAGSMTDIYSSFGEGFKALGGKKAMAVSAGVGLIGSVFGEAVDFFKEKKTDSNLNVSAESMSAEKINPSSNNLTPKEKITDDTIITYKTGIEEPVKTASGQIVMKEQTKEISFGEIKKFLDENVNLGGEITKTNYYDKDNFFFKNNTTPNEMTLPLLQAMKGYDVGSDSWKMQEYIFNYHSSLDPRAIKLDNWCNSADGLSDELMKNYGKYIMPDARDGQKLEFINERTKNNVNFFTDEEYEVLGRPNGSSGVNNGDKSCINIDAYDNLPEETKKSYRANSVNNLSDEMISEKYIKDNIYHESIHQISSKDVSTGVMNRITGEHRGINEAATEFMTLSRPESLYSETGRTTSGYIQGIDTLQILDRSKIISKDDLFSAYFSNDYQKIENILKGGSSNRLGLTNSELELFDSLMDKATLKTDINAKTDILNLFKSKKVAYTAQ